MSAVNGRHIGWFSGFTVTDCPAAPANGICIPAHLHVLYPWSGHSPVLGAAVMTAVASLSGRVDRDASPTNKWVVAMTVLVGGLASSISGSSVNVALPHIQATFGVNTQQVTWVATSFLTALVVVMPLTAWLSSVLGRKLMYLLALSTFTLASAGCGLSQTFGELIFFRVVAGLGGGAMLPTSQAIMRETFPPEEQGQAMGIFGMIAFLGPAVGPTLGGWLTDNYTWHWIFFVNLP
ncbi:MAG TPA: MFS transporter, partial [bacterium]|nr:MFS transporter [bacterium]